MLLDLIKEVYYLAKFKAAISSTNLGSASKYLEKHKLASDAVEVELKTTMSDAKVSMTKQKELMDGLIDKL